MDGSMVVFDRPSGETLNTLRSGWSEREVDVGVGFIGFVRRASSCPEQAWGGAPAAPR
jgi:hypothetical protein